MNVPLHIPGDAQSVDWLIVHICSAILCLGAESLCSRRIYDSEWVTVALRSVFWIHRKWCTHSAVWLLYGWCHVKLLPSRRTFGVQYATKHQFTVLFRSHIRRVHVCLALTCHLHFWGNDLDLLRATAVARGWNRYRNNGRGEETSGFELVTFRPRVLCSATELSPPPGVQLGNSSCRPQAIPRKSEVTSLKCMGH